VVPGPTGKRPLAALGVGAAAGLVSGLLGVGGGVVLVPGIVWALGTNQRRAVANSLLAIIPISIVGVATYYLASGHHVRFDLGVVLAVGGIAGAPLGVAVGHRVSDRQLQVAFGILMVAAALRLLLP
jgi:uncharacterized membrane protein YfcA